MKKKNKKAFTLIELVVSVGLMVLLISIVSMIFKNASYIYKLGEADMLVHTNTRAALERMAKDLTGMLHAQTGKQKFSMTNGGEDNFIAAKDSISFTSITSVLNIQQPVKVSYSLVPTLDTRTGKQKETVLHHQKIYTLFVEYRDLDGQALKDSHKEDIKGDLIAEYITSFNLRYMAYQQGTRAFKYFQLDEQPGVDEVGNSYVDMAGKNNVIGDKKPKGKEPRMPSAIEVSFTIVESEKERARRTSVQTISIPVH